MPAERKGELQIGGRPEVPLQHVDGAEVAILQKGLLQAVLRRQRNHLRTLGADQILGKRRHFGEDEKVVVRMVLPRDGSRETPIDQSPPEGMLRFQCVRQHVDLYVAIANGVGYVPSGKAVTLRPPALVPVQAADEIAELKSAALQTVIEHETGPAAIADLEAIRQRDAVDVDRNGRAHVNLAFLA